MPSPKSFYRAFGIKGAARDLNWHADINYAEHVAVVPYQSYKYEFHVTFWPLQDASSSSSLLKRLRSLTRATHTVTTRYGNPYECHLTSIASKSIGGKKLSVVMKGKARRI